MQTRLFLWRYLLQPHPGHEYEEVFWVVAGSTQQWHHHDSIIHMSDGIVITGGVDPDPIISYMLDPVLFWPEPDPAPNYYPIFFLSNFRKYKTSEGRIRSSLRGRPDPVKKNRIIATGNKGVITIVADPYDWGSKIWIHILFNWLDNYSQFTVEYFDCLNLTSKWILNQPMFSPSLL